MHKYPEATETTIDIALAALNAQGPDTLETIDCSALWQVLSTAAREAAEVDEPDWPIVKSLWLVADACSMTLTGDSTNEPFGPLAVFDQRRSAIPQDFGPSDFSLFSGLSMRVGSRALRARLADLAWIGSKRKDVEDARRAIDAYVEEPLNEKSWVTSIEEWRRAVTLCMQLKAGAQDRFEKIEKELINTTIQALRLKEEHDLALARLLFDRRLASAAGKELAELLAERGKSLLIPGRNIWQARGYLNLAAQWFTRLHDQERTADMTVLIAESFELEADHRIAGDPQNGHLVAQYFLQDSIQTLRNIPKARRSARDVEANLQRLMQRLAEAGGKAVESMQTISAGKIDIREIVELSERAASGKNLLEALLVLANNYSGANLEKMTVSAEESMREFFFSRLFGSSHLSRDGRVIAKSPGGGFNQSSDEHEKQVFAKIMQHYNSEINIVCHAQIIPIWHTLSREHTIRKYDLVQLMSVVPIIPPGRASQFAKGLWEGFEGDFASAIYLLAPQVEHLVRWHLKQVGAITTTLDPSGIENEVGLSSLVEIPELKIVFDKNIIFELQALFCTSLGANLRNEVAHGLLSEEDGHSTLSIYAWWWVLRLTLMSFMKARIALAKPGMAESATQVPMNT